jgi:hypothetical protein
VRFFVALATTLPTTTLSAAIATLAVLSATVAIAIAATVSALAILPAAIAATLTRWLFLRLIPDAENP